MEAFGEIDYTAVCVACCGVVTALIGGFVAIRLKKLELRALESARAAERSAQRAAQSAEVPALPKRKRKKPPTHPDG